MTNKKWVEPETDGFESLWPIGKHLFMDLIDKNKDFKVEFNLVQLDFFCGYLNEPTNFCRLGPDINSHAPFQI